MTRVPVKPELIGWACERSGQAAAALQVRFPQLAAWQRGDAQPTIKQLEKFAAATHTPFGFFFLPKPPVEKVPIPDFRTVGGAQIKRPSPDVLDTIYLCQQRQDWYRENARIMGDDPLAFVKSATVQSDVVSTATRIRNTIRLQEADVRQYSTWENALRRFIEKAEDTGVMVMVSGIVGTNTHRPLDPDEFRGFALADPLAPLVFINGADSKSAQMFTLAHEFAHLWLGESGLSDVTPASTPRPGVERWCNAVAAEVLVPLADIRREFRPGEPLTDERDRLTRLFKVSSLVILRRIFDTGGITRDRFDRAYREEVARLSKLLASRRAAGGTGGDFYRTTAARVGKRFARAILASTWEGRSTFTEAFRLLGCSDTPKLKKLGEIVGVS